MANISGKAYGFTALCPVLNGVEGGRAYADLTRDLLRALPTGRSAPLAAVPGLYMCRFYVLDDVFYEGSPAREEHLTYRYLVFCANFHGDRDEFLRGLWRAAEETVRRVFGRCAGFDKVSDAWSFADYLRRCQVNNALYFNGSTDDPRDEQLKALYLKQEFTRFAFDHYGKSAAELQEAFAAFTARVRPGDLEGPTWPAGMEREEGR